MPDFQICLIVSNARLWSNGAISEAPISNISKLPRAPAYTLCVLPLITLDLYNVDRR